MSNKSFHKSVQLDGHLVIHELNMEHHLSFDVEQFDLAELHALNPSRYPFLLESVAKSKPIPGSTPN